MTRNQRLTMISVGIALVTATIGGYNNFEKGKETLGIVMLAAASIGWILFLWRMRVMLRQRA